MMKSINKRHRKIVLYHLAKSLSDTGREIFRIFKQAPQSPWTTVKIHKEFDAAKNHMKTLIGARNAVEERDFNRKMSLLRRVNVESKRIPRLSATDWKYLEWMKETGRLTDEQKETMNWYKRQEAIDTPVQQTDPEQPISA
jgi:hypothetical protein